jgi:hypothetical protein
MVLIMFVATIIMVAGSFLRKWRMGTAPVEEKEEEIPAEIVPSEEEIPIEKPEVSKEEFLEPDKNLQKNQQKKKNQPLQLQRNPLQLFLIKRYK